MGILDGLNFGSSGVPGLLDLLRNNALNQQFSSGLPSDQAQYGQQAPQMAPAMPMQANAQMAPVPQQPPAVIQAQPSPMQQPMQNGAPPAPEGPGVGDRLMAGLQGFANGGALLPALAGGISGFAAGQTPQQQTQNVTARALLAKGVDPQTVAAAIQPGNTELLKTVIAQTYGQGQFTQETDKDGNIWNVNKLTGQKTVALQQKDDKFQHITRKGGPLEGETSGILNTKTGEEKWDTGTGTAAPATGVQAIADDIAQKRASGASRDELVKLIPTQYQGYITSLLDGKATPVNMGRGPERGALMTLAHSIDPAFDETMIPARIQTAKDFTPQGKSGASIVAFNTVQHHIGKLSDDFEKLGDAGQGGFQLINAARNGLATQTSFDPQRQKAVQAVNDDIKAVTDEMSAAYKAGHVSDTEIKSWNSLVNSNLPLNQAHQAISDFVDLLNGKRDALNTVHRQIMGGDAQIIDKEENAAISKKVHDRNDGITSAPTANAPPDRSAIEAEMRRRGLMK